MQLQAPFVVQHHHGQADNRLGHAINAEKRIRLHGALLRDVHHAVQAVVNQLAAPLRQSDDAGQLISCHGAIHISVYVLQALAGHADISG